VQPGHHSPGPAGVPPGLAGRTGLGPEPPHEALMIGAGQHVTLAFTADLRICEHGFLTCRP
jgi:hypothetical protein